MSKKNIFILTIFSLIIVTLCNFEIEIIRRQTNTKLQNKQSNRLLQANENPVELSENREFFTTQIELGTPSQQFRVQIDTTTSVTWVPSSECVNCNVTNRYNHSASTTGRTVNKTIEIEDEDGDVKGLIAYDRVQLGKLEVDNFGFVEVNQYEDDYRDYPDGKLGLGFRSQHGVNFSFLETLKNAGKIQNKIFSLSNIRGNSSNAKLIIGGYPNGLARNAQGKDYSICNVTQTDDLDDDYRDSWVCEISHVKIGPSANFTQYYEIDGRAIFDSGYNYISVPRTYLSYFRQNYFFNHPQLSCKENVLDDDEHTFTCTFNGNLKDLNPINFLIGGFSYKLPAEDLMRKIEGENIYEFLIRFNRENDNVWFLGLPFLNQFTTVFNAEENHVGFIGGQKTDFTNEWTNWYNSSNTLLREDQIFYLIVGASILGALLLVLVLFIIVHSIKRRRLDEHGPLINETN